METREKMETLEDVASREADRKFGKIQETLEDASEQFETFSSNARRNAEHTWEKAIELIQENPASSLGIALLVGAGIGAAITAWAKD